MKIKESLNVTFDETTPPSKTSPLVDDDLDEEEAIKVTEKKNLENDIEDETLEIDKVVNFKESRNHPLKMSYKTLIKELLDESWIIAMQEELNQCVSNDAWELVPQPKNMIIIGTKWAFRNKLDENGVVYRTKASLEDSKPMKTPMTLDTKLVKDEECEPVDSTKYRGMIGSLLYLMASRPDIVFSVCLCARFK
nr:hypothetical protein [Tanacetum cinerariifolium]